MRRRGADRSQSKSRNERVKSFPYDDLMKRDKVNLDIFWLKDEAGKKAPTPLPPRSSPPTSKRPGAIRHDCRDLKG
jgi:hypothetical protein